ncbi:MAG: aldo/keto reductase [Cyclobacteriaceae bacterium]
MDHLTFENGDKMPMLGLGTWKSAPGEVHNAVLEAIKAGYRHIDCAKIYGNEKEVGNALHEAFSKGWVKREETWITSKLWNSDHKREQVIPALKQTLNDLQLTYLDLYLVHWPVVLKEGVGFPEGPQDFLSLEEVPIFETWQGMEEAKESGLARHIGVSNFSAKKIARLCEQSAMQPEMNQVEMHPYFPQSDLVEFCRSKNVHMTAYSPLGSGDRPARAKKENEPKLMEDATIKKIAEKHQVSPAQVLIGWHVNRGVAVIPKSVNPNRIRQNLAAGELKLDEEDMRKIADIGMNYRFLDGSIWTKEGSPYTMESLWEQ